MNMCPTNAIQHQGVGNLNFDCSIINNLFVRYWPFLKAPLPIMVLELVDMYGMIDTFSVSEIGLMLDSILCFRLYFIQFLS